MTTFEAAAAGLLRSSTEKLEARAQKRAARRANRQTTTASVPTIRRITLMVGALASFTYAASTWHEWAAFVVGGLSALYLEQSFSDD